MKFPSYIFAAGALAFLGTETAATFSVSSEGSAAALTSTLLATDSGLTVVGSSLNAACAGIFSGGSDAVPFFPDMGIVLSTGNPTFLPGQDSDSQSGGLSSGGDSDLASLAGGSVNDACILEIVFTADPDTIAIEFKYVFGSEEYNEFADSSFNDVFGLFLNGDNLAMVPGGGGIVSINNVNLGSNAGFYNNNDMTDFPSGVPYPNFEADGFTDVLEATGVIIPGAENTLKIAIGDVGDSGYDSWVLLQAGSLQDERNGGSDGDPHVKTWSGAWFDYMGECDLVLVHAPNFKAGMPLDIHIRTTVRYDYSFIESAALRIGEDIFEVESFGQHALNGVSGADLNDAESNIAGYPIFYTKKSSKHHVYDIVIGSHENVTISAFKDLVSVKINSASVEHFGDSVGIMGSLSGELLARDGSVMSVDTTDKANIFGQEWQVRGDEPKLFRTDRSPQAPKEQCRLPGANTKQSLRRRLGENGVSRVEAERACAYLAGTSKENCIFDVMAVGDLEIAQAGAY